MATVMMPAAMQQTRDRKGRMALRRDCFTMFAYGSSGADSCQTTGLPSADPAS